MELRRSWVCLSTCPQKRSAPSSWKPRRSCWVTWRFRLCRSIPRMWKRWAGRCVKALGSVLGVDLLVVFLFKTFIDYSVRLFVVLGCKEGCERWSTWINKGIFGFVLLILRCYIGSRVVLSDGFAVVVGQLVDVSCFRKRLVRALIRQLLVFQAISINEWQLQNNSDFMQCSDTWQSYAVFFLLFCWTREMG